MSLSETDIVVQFFDAEATAAFSREVPCWKRQNRRTVLHWAKGADGRGAVLSGDIIQVAQDTRRVSFMLSYPNMMPLSASVVRRIADTAAA